MAGFFEDETTLAAVGMSALAKRVGSGASWLALLASGLVMFFTAAQLLASGTSSQRPSNRRESLSVGNPTQRAVTLGPVGHTPSPRVNDTDAFVARCRRALSFNRTPEIGTPWSHRPGVDPDEPAELLHLLGTLVQRAPDGRLRILFLGDSLGRQRFLEVRSAALRWIRANPDAVSRAAASPGPDTDSPPYLPDALVNGEPVIRDAAAHYWPRFFPENVTKRRRSPVALLHMWGPFFNRNVTLSPFFGTPTAAYPDPASVRNFIRDFAPTHVIVQRGTWDVVFSGQPMPDSGKICRDVAQGFATLRAIVGPSTPIFGVTLPLTYPTHRHLDLPFLGCKRTMDERTAAAREAFVCGVRCYNAEALENATRDGAATAPPPVGLIDAYRMTVRFPIPAVPDGIHLTHPYEAKMTTHILAWLAAASSPSAHAAKPFGDATVDGLAPLSFTPVPDRHCYSSAVLAKVWPPSTTCRIGDQLREVRVFDDLAFATTVPPEPIVRCVAMIGLNRTADADTRWLFELPATRAQLSACVNVLASAGGNDVSALTPAWRAFHLTCAALQAALDPRFESVLGSLANSVAGVLNALPCDAPRVKLEAQLALVRSTWRDVALVIAAMDVIPGSERFPGDNLAGLRMQCTKFVAPAASAEKLWPGAPNRTSDSAGSLAARPGVKLSDVALAVNMTVGRAVALCTRSLQDDVPPAVAPNSSEPPARNAVLTLKVP